MAMMHAHPLPSLMDILCRSTPTCQGRYTPPPVAVKEGLSGVGPSDGPSWLNQA
jgi:hypothetical protein